MTIKDKNTNFKEEFEEDFYSEATKQSKNSSLNLDKQIENIKNESIYKIPSSLNPKRFKYTQEAIYCYLNANYEYKDVYLRIKRESSKYSYAFGYFDSEEISEDNFKYLSNFYTNKKPITENDNSRNKFLSGYAKDKFEFKKEELDNIILDLMNTKGFEQITHDFNVFNQIATKKELEKAKEEKIKYFSFSDYPKDIQEEAKSIFEEDSLFENLLFTIGITHNGDITLKEQLILVLGSLFVGYPVNTEIGGATGDGKSDLVYTTIENYPKRYIQKLRKFSSKYLYYAKDLFDKDYNILIFDDVDYSKEDNIETIKTFTDNKEKVKELRTVVKENNENKAKSFTLDGSFLSILSYAKTGNDEELSNRLFNGFIDTKKDKTEVKNTIKKNVLTDMDNNTLLERLNLINQCCIQYLIEEDFTVFNPFNILFNPKEFNNRDVSSFINLVDTVSFYHKNKRNVISFNDKKVVIGNYQDYKFVLDRWDNEIQNYKVSYRQELILQLLDSFDSEEDFLEYVESKREEYRKIDSHKAKTSFKNGLNTLSTLSKKLGVQNKTLKTDLDTSQEKGNRKNLLELGLIYREPLDSNEYRSPYIYGKVKGMASNSFKSMDIMDIIKIYQSFDNLNVKISFLIYFINRYNILISYKKKKYISSFCSEYSEPIENYESLCSFLQSFMDNITEWDISENPSSEDIKIHFEILKESENFLIQYLEENISINENKNKGLKSESDKNQWIYQENINYINNENLKEDDSEEIDSKIDIDTGISEEIQVNLEYYKTGLTKQEIIEKFELDSDSEDYDYKILKIEKTLDGLVKSNILRIHSKGFKQVYKLRGV